MLTSEMIADVRAHGFDDTSESTILSLLNDSYYDVCSREPWPFLESTGTLTVNTTTGQVTSPTNIEAIISLSETDSGRTLYPMRLDDFTDQYASQLTKQGGSQLYYTIANDYYLYPVPNTGTFVARFLVIPTALTSSPDSTPIIPIMHHRVIVMGALAKLAVMEDDPDLSAVYTNQFETRIQQMRASIWTRQYDEVDTIKVVDWEDYVDESMI